MTPARPTTLLGRRRDDIVVALANAILRCGSPWLQAMIGGSIKLGLTTAARSVGPCMNRAPTIWHKNIPCGVNLCSLDAGHIGGHKDEVTGACWTNMEGR